MTQPLTQGEKNRRANLRRLKAIGAENARVRAATARRNQLMHLARMEDRRDDATIAREARQAEHFARMEDRRILAVIDKRDRAAAGLARRDAHNAALKAASSVVDSVQMRMELVSVNDNGSTMTVAMRRIAA